MEEQQQQQHNEEDTKGFKRRLKAEVDAKVAKKQRKQLTPQQKEKLQRLYYNPRVGYGDVRKVYQNAKAGSLGVTYEQVNNWMGDQYVVQANEPTNKPKQWNSIAAAGPGYNYQMDLIDYTRYRTDGYGWILCIIDVYSRKVGARAIKVTHTRTGKASIRAKVKWEQYLELYKEIVEDDFEGRYPKDLNCDNEFIEKEFQRFVASKGTVIHYSDPKDYNKNAIVERFNRTIELMIQKHRFATDDIDWPSYLQDLIHNYNNRYHSTIKANPQDVWDGKEKSHQKIVWLWNTLKVGDKVRRKLNLNIFAKGDELRYSRDTYVLMERKGNRWKLRNIRTGFIDDNNGRWYKESQLQKVNQIVNPERAAEGPEEEAQNYSLNKEGEDSPSDVEEESEEEKEKEKETEEPVRVDRSHSKLDEQHDGGLTKSKKGIFHSKTLQQLALNRRLKKYTRNASEQPHEEVEEDPDRPGHVRYVIPKRLVPRETRNERQLKAKRRLDIKTFSNQTEERRRKRRKKGK